MVFDNMLMGLQSVIDPEVIVVGGGISARPELFEAFERMMDQAHVLPIIPRPCIKPAQNGNDANLLGAVRTLRRSLGECD